MGHTLRKPATNITQPAVKWSPQGTIEARPRNSWRRDAQVEIISSGAQLGWSRENRLSPSEMENIWLMTLCTRKEEEERTSKQLAWQSVYLNLYCTNTIFSLTIFQPEISADTNNQFDISAPVMMHTSTTYFEVCSVKKAASTLIYSYWALVLKQNGHLRWSPI